MPFRPYRNQLNDGNFGDVLYGTLTTTNNSPTPIVWYLMPENGSVYFTVPIVGRRTDGGNAGDGCVLTLKCAYKSVNRVVTQIGSDTAAQPYSSASINSSAASSSVSGQQVLINVAGTTGATINWTLASGLAIQAQ